MNQNPFEVNSKKAINGTKQYAKKKRKEDTQKKYRTDNVRFMWTHLITECLNRSAIVELFRFVRQDYAEPNENVFWNLSHMCGTG